MTEAELRDLLKRNPALKARGLAPQGQKKKPPPAAMSSEEFDSDAERRYYQTRILPALRAGIITHCELHREFELLPALEHGGQKHRRRVYTPDFFLRYRDGSTQVVEVKGRVIKKLQRDYPLRRHLFLYRYCIPNGWRFLEVHDDEV